MGLSRLSEGIKSLHKDGYKKYKYLDQLPTGEYKSVQMLLADMIEYCGEDNIRAMEKVMIERGDDLRL